MQQTRDPTTVGEEIIGISMVILLELDMRDVPSPAHLTGFNWGKVPPSSAHSVAQKIYVLVDMCTNHDTMPTHAGYACMHLEAISAGIQQPIVSMKENH